MLNKALSRSEIVKILKEHSTLLQRYGVKKIGLFGSFSKKIQRKNSDIDLAVEFQKPSFDNYMSLISYLEKLFGKKVEMLTKEGINNIRVGKIANDIKRSIMYV